MCDVRTVDDLWDLLEYIQFEGSITPKCYDLLERILELVDLPDIPVEDNELLPPNIEGNYGKSKDSGQIH